MIINNICKCGNSDTFIEYQIKWTKVNEKGIKISDPFKIITKYFCPICLEEATVNES